MALAQPNKDGPVKVLEALPGPDHHDQTYGE